jgi:hypothetical protein
MPKKSLADVIKDYQKDKKKLIPILIALGLVGLIFPILPGIAILFLSLLLIFPRRGEEVIRKIRSIFGLNKEY